MASLTLLAPMALICAAVMTPTAYGAALADWGNRVAVTTVSGSWFWAMAEEMAHSAAGNAAMHVVKVPDFIQEKIPENKEPSPSSPTALGRQDHTRACNRLIGRYPGWWNDLPSLPRRVFKRPVAELEVESGIRPLTVAGAAQVRLGGDRFSLLLPVELRHVNHTASTNVRILRPVFSAKPYNA